MATGFKASGCLAVCRAAAWGSSSILPCNRKPRQWLQEQMLQRKREMETCVPFAMDPVVYDFSINTDGTKAELLADGTMPDGYHALVVPGWLKQDLNTLSPRTRGRNWNASATRAATSDNASGNVQAVAGSHSADICKICRGWRPFGRSAGGQWLRCDGSRAVAGRSVVRSSGTRSESTADHRCHRGCPAGRLHGCSRDRLLRIIVDIGSEAIARGEVGVMTLAAGVGSRWTKGAGVVKALNPFCRMAGPFPFVHGRSSGEDASHSTRKRLHDSACGNDRISHRRSHSKIRGTPCG